MSPGVTRSMCWRNVATAVSPRQSQIGNGMAPMASWASVASTPLAYEQASGWALASHAFVPNGLDLSPSKFSLANVGLSMSQVNVDLPISMDHQCPVGPQSPHPVTNKQMLSARSL